MAKEKLVVYVITHSVAVVFFFFIFLGAGIPWWLSLLASILMTVVVLITSISLEIFNEAS